MKPTSLILFAALLFAGGALSANAQTKLMPKCKTQTDEGDVACWMKVQNKGDCYVWNSYPATDEKVTWSGQCKAGQVDGKGELVWIFDAGTQVNIASYVNGQEHGKWEIRHADGSIDDAVYDKGEEVSLTPRFNPKFVVEGEILRYNTDLAATEAGQNIVSRDRDFFEKALKENPDIETVYLTSWGGDVETSYEIADLIIDYELDTHVVDICYSACSTLFLGGEKRTMERGSKLGFHRGWWNPDNMEEYYNSEKDAENWETVFDFASWVYEDAQEEIYDEFQFLLERGVEPFFAIKTIKEAPDDDGWYPRRKELLDANFLTE